jgi:hypothetical protein
LVQANRVEFLFGVARKGRLEQAIEPTLNSPLTKSLRHDSFALNSGTDSDGIGSAA